MKKIGIVPAAGMGSRWGGYSKFLLPCGDREWLLDRTIRVFPNVDKVVVTYNEFTMESIVEHLVRTKLSDLVSMKENANMEKDFYGSMLVGMAEEADYYYFAMPDTFFPARTFSLMPPYGISLGVHRTETPERYGVIRDGKVVNKEPGEPGLAWGVLGWDKDVRDLWLASDVDTYTDAINLALESCEVKLIPMLYYYDFATWFDYVEFIRCDLL
jgi:hypothetical protein